MKIKETAPLLLRVWKDPVWSKVIAAIIIAALGSLGIHFLGVWTDILNFLISLGTFVVSETKVPNWLLGIISIPSIIFIIILFLFIKDKLFGETSDPKKEYFQDNFFGLIWAWRYTYEGQVERIFTLCPKCNYQILPRDNSFYDVARSLSFKCDECGYEACPSSDKMGHIGV